MESSDTVTVSTCNFHSFSSSSSSSPPLPPTPPIHTPCAACKILRRRCADKCVLAPYFPPTEPLKFATAHRIFGASNIIKLLQELPEIHRDDAVSSMVYEAGARIRDPVYGSAGAICQLQRRVDELQAELLNLRAQQKSLLALICMQQEQLPATPPPALLLDEFNPGSVWEDELLWN
ncbi:LOB domain-containing protein 1-like [Canna indica]|uniref:LOB domain-containing protein 1-like n=1 Tax=Canna indica TaxID=4628 RepID=A0AAQ3KDY9_9LILI|nr:LOB domain-containing protein 1-like [Canna indica]